MLGGTAQVRSIPVETVQSDMKVLVVDDDAMLRRLVCRYLATQGHETVEAGDGNEAVRVASQLSFDLVITDWAMPGMNGGELVARLRDQQYPAAYLVMSGEAGQQTQGIPFLAKPFSPARLLAAIETLGQATPPSLSELLDAAGQAKAAWRAARAEWGAMLAEMLSGNPEPGSCTRVEEAGWKRVAALKRYRERVMEYRAAFRRDAKGGVKG